MLKVNKKQLLTIFNSIKNGGILNINTGNITIYNQYIEYVTEHKFNIKDCNIISMYNYIDNSKELIEKIENSLYDDFTIECYSNEIEDIIEVKNNSDIIFTIATDINHKQRLEKQSKSFNNYKGYNNNILIEEQALIDLQNNLSSNYNTFLSINNEVLTLNNVNINIISDININIELPTKVFNRIFENKIKYINILINTKKEKCIIVDNLDNKYYIKKYNTTIYEIENTTVNNDLIVYDDRVEFYINKEVATTFKKAGIINKNDLIDCFSLSINNGDGFYFSVFHNVFNCYYETDNFIYNKSFNFMNSDNNFIVKMDYMDIDYIKDCYNILNNYFDDDIHIYYNKDIILFTDDYANMIFYFVRVDKKEKIDFNMNKYKNAYDSIFINDNWIEYIKKTIKKDTKDNITYLSINNNHYSINKSILQNAIKLFKQGILYYNNNNLIFCDNENKLFI